MTMAKVLCLTLKGMVSVQRDVFKVFDTSKNKRVCCEGIPALRITAWREKKRPYNERYYH